MNYPKFTIVVGSMVSAMAISALTLAGCGTQEAPMADTSVTTAATPVPAAQDAPPTSPDAPTPMADAPVPMADASVPVTESPAQAVPTAAPTSASVLATADGEKSGVRIDVTELKRSSGDTVNLKFVLINDSDEPLNFYGHYLGDSAVRSDHKSVGGVHLVDPAGKKKYLVVRDAEEKCVCSTDVEDAKRKTRVNLWAKFPAPPAGVQKISIVIPHFSPMDDVPISQ